MQRHPGLAAVVLGLLLVAVLAVILVGDPRLADHLVREDDVVEWLQAAVFVLAVALALRSAWETWHAGSSPVFEVLVAALLSGLIIGELDLDRILVGRKIISTRFLVDPHVWVGWRALAAFILVAPPTALALYAIRRRSELVSRIRRGIAEPAGRVFLAGVLIFGLTEMFEGPLGRIPGVPRYFLEETLELIAAVCFGVALYAHAGAARRRRNQAL